MVKEAVLGRAMAAPFAQGPSLSNGSAAKQFQTTRKSMLGQPREHCLPPPERLCVKRSPRYTRCEQDTSVNKSGRRRLGQGLMVVPERTGEKIKSGLGRQGSPSPERFGTVLPKSRLRQGLMPNPEWNRAARSSCRRLYENKTLATQPEPLISIPDQTLSSGLDGSGTEPPTGKPELPKSVSTRKTPTVCTRRSLLRKKVNLRKSAVINSTMKMRETCIPKPKVQKIENIDIDSTANFEAAESALMACSTPRVLRTCPFGKTSLLLDKTPTGRGNQIVTRGSVKKTSSDAHVSGNTTSDQRKITEEQGEELEEMKLFYQEQRKEMKLFYQEQRQEMKLFYQEQREEMKLLNQEQREFVKTQSAFISSLSNILNDIKGPTSSETSGQYNMEVPMNFSLDKENTLPGKLGSQRNYHYNDLKSDFNILKTPLAKNSELVKGSEATPKSFLHGRVKGQIDDLFDSDNTS